MKKMIGTLFTLLLSSCVGGTLSDTSEIEEYPLRPATREESAQLKQCLLSLFDAQNLYATKHNGSIPPLSDLALDNECNRIRIQRKKTEDGFEILGEFHKNENTVRWSVNQHGVIEEHLEPMLYEDDLFE
ncbi:MAG: hypothetical protein M9962_07215 [Oligoflexia bacterium]|nr:hypothetical protein [Oligoflexia bacterium]